MPRAPQQQLAAPATGAPGGTPGGTPAPQQRPAERVPAPLGRRDAGRGRRVTGAGLIPLGPRAGRRATARRRLGKGSNLHERSVPIGSRIGTGGHWDQDRHNVILGIHGANLPRARQTNPA
ncbi:MAG: hypothetical protein LUO93_11155 [Methanomicrobiales archaeon]|nr:hypothetical protein [Methanomicrobiales archaeon]